MRLSARSQDGEANASGVPIPAPPVGAAALGPTGVGRLAARVCVAAACCPVLGLLGPPPTAAFGVLGGGDVVTSVAVLAVSGSPSDPERWTADCSTTSDVSALSGSP